MKAEFWHERWEANQLGFHQQEINSLLCEYWPRLGLDADTTVFVPLCGKSLDMHWLRSAGHPVVGVELSPIAVRDFFSEAELETSGPDKHGALAQTSSPGFDLYCGDFFSLEPTHLDEIGAVYDRASLIALPPEMRSRYAEHMAEILPANVTLLLITIEYDQTKMKGPPHSVLPQEVEGLYGTSFEIERLAATGPTEPPEPFRSRGLDTWTESIWRLRREEDHE